MTKSNGYSQAPAPKFQLWGKVYSIRNSEIRSSIIRGYKADSENGEFKRWRYVMVNGNCYTYEDQIFNTLEDLFQNLKDNFLKKE